MGSLYQWLHALPEAACLDITLAAGCSGLPGQLFINLHHVWPLQLRCVQTFPSLFLRTLTQAFSNPLTFVREGGLIILVDFRIVQWKVHWFCEVGEESFTSGSSSSEMLLRNTESGASIVRKNSSV